VKVTVWVTIAVIIQLSDSHDVLYTRVKADESQFPRRYSRSYVASISTLGKDGITSTDKELSIPDIEAGNYLNPVFGSTNRDVGLLPLYLSGSPLSCPNGSARQPAGQRFSPRFVE
jgi:hypothetical protein